MLARWVSGLGVLLVLLCIVAADAADSGVDERDPDDPRYAGNFRGVVNGPDGKPFAGARVYLAPYDETLGPEVEGHGPVRAVTDEAGRFEFEAPDATFVDLDSLRSRRDGVIIVTADGHGPDFKYFSGRNRTLRSTAAQRIERNQFAFQLETDDVPIRGRLLGADGQPLVGARVRVSSVTIPNNRDLDAHIAESKKRQGMFVAPRFPGLMMFRADLLPDIATNVRTDSDGRFEITGIGRERLASLRVTAPSVVDSWINVMTRRGDHLQGEIDAFELPGEPSSAANYTRILEPGRTITGRVIDRETRQPIAGMRVGKERGFPRDGVHGEGTVTDAEGKFQLRGLIRSSDEVHLTAASPPGMTYESGATIAKDDGPVEIECQRGVPFRLRLIDEAGKPVEARVTYVDVGRNPQAQRPYCYPCRTPYSVAARDAAGDYRGFVIAGPGVIRVEMEDGGAYRATDVKPLEFFAAEIAKLAPKLRMETFGTSQYIHSSMGGIDLDTHAALVLLNPDVDSPPLELTATIIRDVPQRVELVDVDGRLVEGCTTKGMTRRIYDAETRPRGGAFGIRGLHAERARRITFSHEERKLIGFVFARGGVSDVIRVRMEPWGTITGRLLDGAGRPVAKQSIQAGSSLGEANPDPLAGERGYVHTDAAGRFRIDQLVPGQRYDGRYRERGKPEQIVFEGMTLKPGEVIDLGDVRLKPVGIARVREYGSHMYAALLAERAVRSDDSVGVSATVKASTRPVGWAPTY